MSEPIRFRPHHFLCAVGFVGKGYSSEFTANMTEIVIGRLRAPEGGAEVLEVTPEADAICAPCPSRRGTGCESAARIATLDRAHAKALGLAPGDRLTWAEAQARIVAQVQPGDLSRICKGCQWLPFGLCETALSALHAKSR